MPDKWEEEAEEEEAAAEGDNRSDEKLGDDKPVARPDEE